VRVLLAHNRYRLPGGEERHLDLLERGLREAGAEVRRFERTSPERVSPIRGAAIALGMTYRPSSARALGREVDAWRPDVVHAHNLLPLLTPSVLRAAKRGGAAVVLTVHNYRLFCPAGTLVRARDSHAHRSCVRGSSLACGLRGARTSWPESVVYGLALELQRRLRLVDRWVDAYVAPSEFVARLLVEAGFPRARVHVVRNGVPLPQRAETRREYALYAGRLSSEKGIRTLVAASRRAPEVPLVIAGDGPLHGELRAAGRGDAVTFVGRVPADSVDEIRRGAAFAVVPSDCPEVLPFAAIESLAHGTPVIATNQGSLPEIARDGAGEIVAAGDADALAAAMRRWWRRAQSEPGYGAAARDAAEKRFSLGRQTAHMLALYESLVEGRA
jgi:glycosyltransferase involved in cell wall biosynthesis